MYSISSLFFTSLALTTLVSSRPRGNNDYDLIVLLTENGVLPPWPGLLGRVPTEEYIAVLTNTSQTIPELEQKLILLDKKYGTEEQMKKHYSEISKQVLIIQNKYDSILNNLVSVEKQYQEIINSKTMTIAEITEKVEEFEKQYPMELETLQRLFDKVIAEIRENTNKDENKEILQGIEAKEKMMKMMKFMRRK